MEGWIIDMSWSKGMKQVLGLSMARLVIAAVLLTFALAPGPHAQAQEGPKSFESPKQAVAALVEAAKKKDAQALLAVLGPATREWIASGDEVQDEEARSKFVAAYDQKHAIEMEGEDKAVLVVGEDGFPFPFPIVKTASGWGFDPELGKEEILDRRIGGNELNTIQVLLAIADAQKEYAQSDRNGDGLLEYAAKFKSSDGQRDGLYWPTAEGEQLSPLGPLVVEAAAEGYKRDENAADDETGAFHGYRFKLLLKQGEDAPGGAYDYLVDDKMIGGFGVLAWPAKYGVSGIMTFAVSHDGVVYETDLGVETESEAKAIDTFNPGEGWSKVDPE